MLEDVIACLKESKADDYEITNIKKTGWEFYFIKHDLDQNRAKDVEYTNVTVYKRKEVDGKKYIGKASCEIYPTNTKEEITTMVEDLVYRASLLANDDYELVKPIKTEETTLQVETNEKMASDFLATMNQMDETPQADINSYEIFTNVIEKRFINSQGVDVTQTYPESMLEVVTNARDEKQEIELYRLYQLGSCDGDSLKKSVNLTLQYGKDRLQAIPTPDLKTCPVLFSTDDSRTIYRYFLDRLNTQYIYQKVSNWKVGTPISENVEGDKVTLKARKVLPNSSKNFNYDYEGAPIYDCTLIEDGIPTKLWGDRMFSSYLGLEDTFNVSNYEVSGGTKSEAELRSGRYLEVVEFSDFQVSAISGDIFGEIRLGYYHDGDKVTVVKGGSVSGSLNSYLNKMYLSKEQVQYNNALVPSVTKLMDVTITAAE